MSVPHEALQVRFGKRWGLRPQLSKFLVLLITMECVSENVVQQRIGNVAASGLAHQLRRTHKVAGFTLTIKCMRGYGYWIADEDKRRLAAIPEFHVIVQDAATFINQEALGYVDPLDETDEKTGGCGIGTKVLRKGVQ